MRDKKENDFMINALQIGAQQYEVENKNFSGWQSMKSAPRDSTLVELKCTYGVAPWYCLAHWTKESVSVDQQGNKRICKSDKPMWRKLDGGGPFDESSLHWRPYSGEINYYVDPTGGMQNEGAYWRGAVAQKYGLSLDYFEEQVKSTEKENLMQGGPACDIWNRLKIFVCRIFDW